MMLGFGCIEDKARDDIKKLIVGAALKGEDLFKVSEKWNSERDYKNIPISDQPERYTKFWIYDDAIHYMHVNTRHPFSPDGVAAIIIDEPFEVKK